MSELIVGSLSGTCFVAREVDPGDEIEMDKIYKFRYSVFHRELGWEISGAYEKDDYDQTAAHFTVSQKSGEIIGYSRLNRATGRFMIEREFADLVGPEHQVRKKSDTVEPSRFAVSRKLRKSKDGFAVTELLCTVMCKWSRNNGVRYWYMVLELDYLKFLETLFPIRVIGEPKQYGQNSVSVAVIVDLNDIGKRESDAFWGSLGQRD